MNEHEQALAIFDAAIEKVRQQGQPSVLPDGSCLYRGVNGLRCAAGFFISDAEYTTEMERLKITELVAHLPVWYGAALRAAQIAHDDAAFLSSAEAERSGCRQDFMTAFEKKTTEMRAQLAVYSFMQDLDPTPTQKRAAKIGKGITMKSVVSEKQKEKGNCIN